MDTEKGKWIFTRIAGVLSALWIAFFLGRAFSPDPPPIPPTIQVKQLSTVYRPAHDPHKCEPPLMSHLEQFHPQVCLALDGITQREGDFTVEMLHEGRTMRFTDEQAIFLLDCCEQNDFVPFDPSKPWEFMDMEERRAQ